MAMAMGSAWESGEPLGHWDAMGSPTRSLGNSASSWRCPLPAWLARS